MYTKTIALTNNVVQCDVRMRRHIPLAEPVIEVFDYNFYRSPLRVLCDSTPVVFRKQQGTITVCYYTDCMLPLAFNERGQELSVTDLRLFKPKNWIDESIFSKFGMIMALNFLLINAFMFTGVSPTALTYSGMGQVAAGFVFLAIACSHVVRCLSPEYKLMTQAYYDWRELNGDYAHYYRYYL